MMPVAPITDEVAGAASGDGLPLALIALGCALLLVAATLYRRICKGVR